jgi:hypothetical protein
MFFKLKSQLGRELFDRECRAILTVPPARTLASSKTLVVSQLQHKDVLMYLVAIKSFASRVPIGEVLILNDGSLDGQDKQVLLTHVPGVHISPIEAYRSPHCPSGGTWERLLAIAQHSAQQYVIQLDADTVAVGDLPEVVAAAADGVSFALGTWDGQQVETLAQRANDARRLNVAVHDHVQVAAEKVFDQVPGFDQLRYVRGCSGFAGFAPGSVTPQFIESFSGHMTSLLGERWTEWGSEQVMSNVAVANSPRITVLPHPRYCDCNHIDERSAFIHFIGDCRFRGSAYREAGARQAKRLAAS